MPRTGIAVGGPLEGTKISAGYSWNGRMTKDMTGRYAWDSLMQVWCWTLVDSPPTGRRPGRPPKVKPEE